MVPSPLLALGLKNPSRNMSRSGQRNQVESFLLFVSSLTKGHRVLVESGSLNHWKATHIPNTVTVVRIRPEEEEITEM